MDFSIRFIFNDVLTQEQKDAILGELISEYNLEEYEPTEEEKEFVVFDYNYLGVCNNVEDLNQEINLDNFLRCRIIPGV